MNLAPAAGIAIGAFIAFANGANDVSKGIATLAGSGATNLRKAVLWGAICTTAGSLAAFIFAGEMMNTFGKGLLAPGIVPTLSAGIATMLGAAVWVALSTRLGLPVSTTHAIVGSITGVASVAYGLGGMRWNTLGAKVAIPLLLSPVLSMLFTRLILMLWKESRTTADCLCAEVTAEPIALATATNNINVAAGVLPDLQISSCSEVDREAGHPKGVSFTLDHLHWLTSGTVSFARGLNDAPKMVALLLGVAALTQVGSVTSLAAFILVAVGILIGSLVAGLKVSKVMAQDITPMNHREGFIANLVTALLVGPGAAFGLPMSTTHVASGAIIGTGLNQSEKMNWQTVKQIVLAWVVTLPAAALFGVVLYELLRWTGVS